MFRLLWNKKALILLLAVFVALLPQAAGRPAQMLSKTLLTSVGIDKQDGEYVLYGQEVKIPKGGQTSGTETVVEGGGVSLGAAINKLAATTGREVSLAHCNLIVLGAGLDGENIAELLKYFLNRAELNNNCTILYTKEPVKDMLDEQQQLRAKFASDNAFGKPPTLERFFKDYLRASSCSVLMQQPGKAAIFKNGRYAFSLDENQTRALGYLSGGGTKIRITHDNHVLHVLHKKVKINKNKIHMKITAEIESDPFLSNSELTALADVVKSKLELDIKNALEHAYSNGADVLQLGYLYSNFDIKVDVRIIAE